MTPQELGRELSLALIVEILERPTPDQTPLARARDLREALRQVDVVLTSCSPHEDVWAEARYHAAWAHDELLVLTGDLAHLDAQIDHLRALVRSAFCSPAVIDPLVAALSARQDVRADGSLVDVDAAIALQRELLVVADEPREAGIVLGLLVAQRFRASPADDPDQLRDLTEAMALLTDAEHDLRQDDPARAEVVHALGHLHVMSHLAPRSTADTEDDRDLDRGIALLREVAEFDTSAADRLAFALDQRHEEHGRAADRDEAIAILERLCADPDLPGYADERAAELGELYAARSHDDRSTETFRKAVTCLERALAQRLPHREFVPATLISVYLRFRGELSEHDWDRLRALCAELAASDDPVVRDPLWTDILLATDAERAVRHDDPSLCRATIARLTDAVLGPYDPEQDRGVLFAILATLVAHRHGAEWPWPDWSPLTMVAEPPHREVELLDWLRCHQQDVPAEAPDHLLFVTAVALFASRLRDARTQGLDDQDRLFDEVIAELEHAIAVLPHTDRLVPLVELELGRVHLVASASGSGTGNLDRAVELLAAAASGFPRNDPAHARCLGGLGSALFVAYTKGLLEQSRLHQADHLISAALDDEDLEPDLRATLLAALGQTRGLGWLTDQTTGDMRAGIALHEQALSLLPDDDPTTVDVRASLSLLLAARSLLTRNLDDLRAAEQQLETIQPLVARRKSSDWTTSASVGAMLRALRLARLFDRAELTRSELDGLDDLVDAVASNQDRDHADDAFLMAGRVIQAKHRNDTTELASALAAIAGADLQLPEHMPFRNTVSSVKSLATAGQALLAGDRGGFEDEIRLVAARADAAGTSRAERARLLVMQAGMWLFADTHAPEPAALDRSIALLDAAYEAAAPPEPLAVFAAEQLSDTLWRRRGPGDAERSVECGFIALREHARQVLLHEDVAHGAQKAAAIADRAHVLAHRSLAIGRPDLAIAAIESGRGLAMHAATSDTQVGELLREAGHELVALEWERSFLARPGGVEPAAPPAELRRRVVDLLAGTPAERRLLSPPAPEEIAGALRTTGADVLVYLVPGAGGFGGLALHVTADARVGAIPLPLLEAGTNGVVDRYVVALREATGARRAEEQDAVRRWRAELDAVVAWAWRAVMDPVLTELGERPDPHVVLVPCGVLGVVPWHAARDAEQARFALQRAVLSYAASARQLCDVAPRRPRHPAEDAVIVTDPTGDLRGSRQETRYLYRHCYPDGLYLGRVPAGVPEDGPATPEDVLAQLPDARSAVRPDGRPDGASMLHLACHAASGAGPTESHVRLDGAPLSVARLLRHTRATASDAPGALVVLAACQSDLAGHQHDEALTLATAFLAAGAASVVGTRWAVDDRRSAVLMCLFHRYLVVDRLPPAHALRAAQLWALDPDRVLPADVAAVLDDARVDMPLSTWAAFTHQGR